MIIWSGHGYLVAVVVFASSLLMELATESATGNEEFYQQNAVALPAALLIAAGVTFAVDRVAFGSDSEGHSLFFVPLKWWPIILAAFAVIALVHGLVT